MPENGVLNPTLTLQMAVGYSSHVPRLSCTQTDNESINVSLNLMDKSMPYVVPDGAELNIRSEKPDGKYIYKPITVENNVYTFILGGQLTTAVGVSKCAIEVVKDGFVLNSAPFNIVVKPQTAPDAEIVSEEDLETLNSYVFRAESAAEKAEQSEEAAGKSAQAAEQSEQNAAKSAADAAKSAEEAALAIKTAIKLEKSGELVNITDSIEYPFLSLGIYGKTTQDGVPTPDVPVPLVSVGDSGSIELTVNNDGDQTQIVPIPTPDGLPGIPVESKGNYTDSTGQQWISDTIEGEPGKWEYVKRVKKIAIDSVDGYNEIENFGLLNLANPKIVDGRGVVLSNRFRYHKSIKENGICFYYGIQLRLYNNLGSIEAFNEWLTTNSTEVMYPLETPIRTPITDPELIEKLDALHLYYPITNIFAAENAGIKIKYVLDTKKYIDQQIGVIANGSY